MRTYLLILFALASLAFGQNRQSPYSTANRVIQQAGAPSSSLCQVQADVGRVYIRNDLQTTDSPLYICSQNGVGTFGWVQSDVAGAYANTALSNLAAVSINTSLLAQTGVDVGSAAKPFRDLFLFGGGTYGTTSFRITGTPTGARVITIPDASLTLARTDAAQTFTGLQTFGTIAVADGSVGAPTINFGAGTGSTNGFYNVNSNTFNMTAGGNLVSSFFYSGHAYMSFAAGAVINWASNASLYEVSAGILGIGSGDSNTTTGALKLAGIISAGTKFTVASGCATISATVGGATSGEFATTTTGVCAPVITMNGATGLTAPNGWSCWVNDRTSGVMGSQTASSTTTATLKVTTTSGDTVNFGCLAY